jgi:RNA polymerase sigma-70 factor (ECF subfamily)
MDEEINVCDKSVFSGLYHELFGKMRNIFYYQYGQAQKAEEYVQGAFIELWKNCESVGKETAAAFLYSETKKRFLKDSEHYTVRLRFKVSGAKQTEEEYTGPEQYQVGTEHRERLSKGLSGLSELQRVVLLMHRIEKLPYQEIADILALEVGVVEEEICSAVRNLKEELS